MTLSVWLRVIRIKFLLSSVIAVLLGLVISWWQLQQFDAFHAILTMTGVILLHASVDLLNDYWDFKRGIDTQTQRTKVSGGTGVLPEGLLKPSQVYRAGIIFLIIGSLIGIYFVIEFGIVIALILAFAILSIYFYSNKIVDFGLAEVFVTIKGTMIVLGTYFVQISEISMTSVLGGLVVGVLSSLVLFITSFPDYEADKSKGRKTLVIVAGKKRSVSLFWMFPIITYLLISIGIVFEIFPISCLLSFTSLPIVLKSGRSLRTSFSDIDKLTSTMNLAISFSRITGSLFLVSFLLNF
jgi:1,4-dihydroxy-2-naphthoate octaprenyltransferase